MPGGTDGPGVERRSPRRARPSRPNRGKGLSPFGIHVRRKLNRVERMGDMLANIIRYSVDKGLRQGALKGLDGGVKVVLIGLVTFGRRLT